MERQKLIEIQEKEIIRNEKELEATVKRPAEAEAHKTEVLAEGRRIQKVMNDAVGVSRLLLAFLLFLLLRRS